MLRDDFVMGGSIKDWDKKNSDGAAGEDEEDDEEWTWLRNLPNNVYFYNICYVK